MSLTVTRASLTRTPSQQPQTCCSHPALVLPRVGIRTTLHATARGAWCVPLIHPLNACGARKRSRGALHRADSECTVLQWPSPGVCLGCSTFPSAWVAAADPFSSSHKHSTAHAGVDSIGRCGGAANRLACPGWFSGFDFWWLALDPRCDCRQTIWQCSMPLAARLQQ